MYWCSACPATGHGRERITILGEVETQSAERVDYTDVDLCRSCDLPSEAAENLTRGIDGLLQQHCDEVTRYIQGWLARNGGQCAPAPAWLSQRAWLHQQPLGVLERSKAQGDERPRSRFHTAPAVHEFMEKTPQSRMDHQKPNQETSCDESGSTQCSPPLDVIQPTYKVHPRLHVEAPRADGSPSGRRIRSPLQPAVGLGLGDSSHSLGRASPVCTSERASSHCSSWREVSKRRAMKVNRKPGSSWSRHRKLYWLDQSRMQRIIGSWQYHWVNSGLILLSCATLGFSTQSCANMVVEALETDGDYKEPMYWQALETFFFFFFLIDLCLRWACAGLCNFWRDDDRLWHGLDLIVVIMGGLGMTSDLAGLYFPDMPAFFFSNFMVFRALRLAKLVTVVKMVGLMRFFREFRLMLFGTIASMKFFLGVVLVVFFSLYVFGLFFATSATRYLLSHRADWETNKKSELFNMFGTLDRTLLSLYMSISGGNDWIVYYETLSTLGDGCDILFLLFITFVLFAVLNIVTAVFLDSASRLNMAEDRMIVEEEITTKGHLLDSLRRLFEEVDIGGFGTVTQEEFENQLKDDKINAFFHALKLDTRDARRLFTVLDQNGSGEVDIDEFITGCYELQGQASSLDSKIMQMEVSFIRDRMVALGESIRELKDTKSFCELEGTCTFSDPHL